MVLGLLVVRLVEVASGALAHFAATAVEHVVGLGHALEPPVARMTAASDIVYLATLARLFVR